MRRIEDKKGLEVILNGDCESIKYNLKNDITDYVSFDELSGDLSNDIYFNYSNMISDEMIIGDDDLMSHFNDNSDLKYLILNAAQQAEWPGNVQELIENEDDYPDVDESLLTDECIECIEQLQKLLNENPPNYYYPDFNVITVVFREDFDLEI